MAGFLTFRDLSHPSWTSGEVVNTLTSAAQIFIFVFSPAQQSLVGWSGNSQNILGVKDFEIARDGNVFLRHVHIDDRFQLLNDLEQTFSKRRSLRLVYRWLRPDTEQLRWLLCRGEPIHRGEGLVYEGVICDITEEMRLVGGDIQYGAALFEALQSWVMVLDADGRVLYKFIPVSLVGFNFGDPGFKPEYLQSGKVLQESFSDSSAGIKMKAALEDLSTGRTGQLVEKIRWKDKTVEIEARTLPTGSTSGRITIFVRDCTTFSKLESENTHLKRAESFVQLASGIFHNVNNSLQTIVGYAAAIQRHPHDYKLIMSSCDGIMQMVEQSSGLTHQLLAFKDSLLESQVKLDLNVVVMTALNRIQDLLAAGTKVSVSLGTIPPITANFHALAEGVEALLRIAHNVLGKVPGITIQTAPVDTTSGQPVATIPSGSFCRLSVTASNGSHGAEKSPVDLFQNANVSVQQLFHELESSLSRFGAYIRLERGPSNGAAIVAYFPLSSVDKTAAPINSALESPQILFVDDDIEVRKVISAILSDAGYECITAENRRDAMVLFKKHASTLKLVLMDALLANEHGSAVLRQIKRLKHDIPVIGISGASAHDVKALLDSGAAEVLRKPVNPAKLLSAVRGLIGEQKAA